MSNATDPELRVPPSDLDFTRCDQEVIHQPGTIQPFGILLIVEPVPDLTLVGVSRNAGELLGEASDRPILGLRLREVLGTDIAEAVWRRFGCGELRGELPWQTTVTPGDGSARFHLAVHAQTDVILIELERAAVGDEARASTALMHLQEGVAALRDGGSDLDDLAGTTVRYIRLLTGYDRVVLYQFDADDNGLTIAEDKSADWDQSLLGRLCPASDIPAQARSLYRRNTIRWVADRDAPPAPLDLEPGWSARRTAHGIDLTFARLRSHSPAHLRIHRHLGIDGSMSLSIINRERLWGLVICHHRQPHLPSPCQRSAACALTDAFALRVGPVERAVSEQARRKDLAQLSALLVQMAEAEMVSTALFAGEITIGGLFCSTGAAVLYDGDIALLGSTPPETDVRELIAELRTRGEDGKLFATNNVGGILPHWKHGAIASGVLAVFLSADRSDTLLWFRPEEARPMSWGGLLQAATDKPEEHLEYSHKWAGWRRDFARPWTDWEAEIAETLRRDVMEVIVRSLRRARSRDDNLSRLREAQAAELHRANVSLRELAAQVGRARDEAEQANLAKSRFLSGMSHELRTPLSGVLGYVRLLLAEGGLSAKQTARVEAMAAAGSHLLELIQCVLDMSEIETGHFALRKTDADLVGLAKACLDLIRPTAQSKGLELALRVQAGVPKLIEVDATRLRQIVINLLGNAVKFTSAGSVELHLRTDANPARFWFEVVDTGPGIPVSQKRDLFREFVRLDNDLTRSASGAGLGLALSSRLAGVLGGKLGHRDRPGGGSVFWVELPMVVAAPVTHADLRGFGSAGARHPSEPRRSLRVLVVDDVAMNREIASAFIRSGGHTVACASSGAQALEIVHAQDFDIVMMDVSMPDMDGLETTRRIRAAETGRRLPIVAVTAQAFTDQVEECRRAGMDGHVVKPFTVERLLTALAPGFERAG